MNSGSQSTRVDLNALELLRQLLPCEADAAVSELIHLFIKQTDQDVEELKTGVADRNTASIAKVAHRIKSAASQMGAASFSERSTEIEKAALTAATTPSLQTLCAELIVDYEQTKVILLAQIKK